MKSLRDVELTNKSVGLRVDLNVPIDNGEIVSSDRLSAVLPTIIFILEKTENLCLISHLGRPKEGHYDESLSLDPIRIWFEKRLNRDISLVNSIDKVNKGLNILENIRFFEGESSNSDNLANLLANKFDIYVMDAFATAHRESASTYGAILQSKESCAGLLFHEEVHKLNLALSMTKPLISIVGGSKVSTKLAVLKNLIDKSKKVLVGGGIANTFLKAAGISIGNSIYEESMLFICEKMLNTDKVILPEKVIISESPSSRESFLVDVSDVRSEMMILDLEFKKESISFVNHMFIWNGPLGIFEIDAFSKGTRDLVKFLEEIQGEVIAGGGETIYAINKFSNQKKFSYVSTAGGAFIEFISGKKLPSVVALGVK